MLGNGSVGKQLEDLPAVHPYKHDILQTQTMTRHAVVFNNHRHSVNHKGVDAVQRKIDKQQVNTSITYARYGTCAWVGSVTHQVVLRYTLHIDGISTLLPMYTRFSAIGTENSTCHIS